MMLSIPGALSSDEEKSTKGKRHKKKGKKKTKVGVTYVP